MGVRPTCIGVSRAPALGLWTTVLGQTVTETLHGKGTMEYLFGRDVRNIEIPQIVLRDTDLRGLI